MANVFRYADLDATTNVLMRQAVAMTAQKNLHLVRESTTAWQSLNMKLTRWKLR